MIKEILLATHNAHKKAEVQYMFDLYGVKIIGLDDLNYTGEMPIEDGRTFDDNAHIKASFFYNIYKMPTIGEDSGLCIDYLNGLPGINTARFMSHLSDAERNELICSMMRDVPDRAATFYSTMCYIDEEDMHYSTGIMEGVIADAPRGTNGFGYDPIFIPKFETVTLAEMDEVDKNGMSHRNLAVCGLADYFGIGDIFE